MKEGAALTRSPGLSPHLRRLERSLGIDRRGRTTWVWLVPLLVGVITGVASPFMPGIPQDFGLVGALVFAVFGFLSMTVISVLYMVTFDHDRNQLGDGPDDTTWSGDVRH